MHWLGPGSKIGLNDKLGKFKETSGNKKINDKLAYFVSDRHPVLLLETVPAAILVGHCSSRV